MSGMPLTCQQTGIMQQEGGPTYGGNNLACVPEAPRERGNLPTFAEFHDCRPTRKKQRVEIIRIQPGESCIRTYPDSHLAPYLDAATRSSHHDLYISPAEDIYRSNELDLL